MNPLYECCEVPWTLSPSGGLELRHIETDVAPDCSVRFLAGRINADGKLDQTFVVVKFTGGAFVRVHWHDDRSGVECLGYGSPNVPIGQRSMFDTWTIGDVCPDPKFYRLLHSPWIAELPSLFARHRHYILDGRDGCIEIAAERYNWCEWNWPVGVSLESALATAPNARGEEVASKP